MKQCKKSVRIMIMIILNLMVISSGIIQAVGGNGVQNPANKIRKVILLGGFDEGKTSFLKAIIGENNPDNSYGHTMVIEEEVSYDITLKDGSTMTLKLQDYPGEMTYRDIIPQYFRDASWAFICVGTQAKLDGSTCYKDSSHQERNVQTCITNWIDCLNKTLRGSDRQCQIVIVKTKIDVCRGRTMESSDLMGSVRQAIKEKIDQINSSRLIVPFIEMIEVDSIGHAAHARSEFERIIRNTVDSLEALSGPNGRGDYVDVGEVEMAPERSDCCTIM